VRRVAESYFGWKNRSVAIYLRQEGSAEADPALAALEPQPRAQALALLKEWEKYDAESLRATIAQVEASRERVPPEFRPALEYVLKRAKARLERLEAGTTAPPPAAAPPPQPPNAGGAGDDPEQSHEN